MTEKNQIFNEYIEEYKKLDTQEKRNELILYMKEMIAIFKTLAEKDNIELEMLENKEIYDIANDNYSEDDFLEAAMVYLGIIQDTMGQYLIKTDKETM